MKKRGWRLRGPHMVLTGSLESDAQGWWRAACDCGYRRGVYPGVEEAVDVLMEHAREVGHLEAAKVAPTPNSTEPGQ